MDRFKFRVWDKEKGVMVYLDLGNENPAVSRLHVALLSDYIREGNGIIMQSTGLHDKDGKLVYEGDVYQWNGYEVRAGKQIRPIRKGVVEPDIYKIAIVKNIVLGNGTLEVIGNLYENPELVEQQT